MLRFLITRPIAVFMSFLALLILGTVVFLSLPVSLLPDIPIPEVTVQVEANNIGARELEDIAVKDIRNQLLQVNRLKDIKSSTRNNLSTINLTFEYGTNTNLSFIDVNEKIDQIMGSLPKEIKRPKVIKANASDIPVFYLNASPKDEALISPLELASFSKTVIKRRIEQLPEVAYVDISGYAEPEITITPIKEVFESLGLTEKDLETALATNNLNLGNLLINDGQYQYTLRFLTELKSKEDIENIYLNIQGNIFQIKDLAQVKEVEKTRRGKYLTNHTDGVVFAVRKKSDAQLFELQAKIELLLASFKTDYPNIDFHITQDQTKLLEVSIDNLKSSMLYGGLFAFLIMFSFFWEWKAPLLIGIAIPSSLVIALLGFYLLDISINIISLSGLILGIGLMIDNSIIVIENIRQYISKGESVTNACVLGANEVIKPLLTSALTTCSVFLPLIFLSGISGALFYDQAISVTIALFSSLLVAYLLLPTLLNLDKKTKKTKRKKITFSLLNKSVDFVLKWKIILLLLVAALFVVIYFLWEKIEKKSFPEITKNSITLAIDWNEPLNLLENERRTEELLRTFNLEKNKHNIYLGEQQFLLQKEQQGGNQVKIILDTADEQGKQSIAKIRQAFEADYPRAILEIYETKNLFDEIFSSDRPPLVLHLQSSDSDVSPLAKDASFLYEFARLNDLSISKIPEQQQYFIKIKMDKLILYDIPFSSVVAKLKTIFNQNEIGNIKVNSDVIPIVTNMERTTYSQEISTTQIANNSNKKIPLAELIELSNSTTPKVITGEKSGESLDIAFDKFSPTLLSSLKAEVLQNKGFSAYFSGQGFEDDKNITSLTYILSVSIILLYLILAAQFESLVQPLIVIFSVPIGIFGSLAMLYLFDQTINIISIIGMIVTSGIVVNDAILKVDMINRFIAQKYSMTEAIHIAGERRVRPILMTSLTTILALLPILFSSGLGAELQAPLALSVIGGLTITTLSSIYFIPTIYHLLYARKKSLRHTPQ